MSSNSEQVQPLAAPKIRRRKRLLQNLALMVGTFFLCGLLLELVLRIAGYGNVELYEPDPLLYWKLKPNQNCYTKIDHKPVHVNSLGTRGPEFAVVKPANTIRVLSLGDSKTFGWGLTDLKDKGKELFLDADPVHLNVPGNVIIARQLLTTINGLISLP